MRTLFATLLATIALGCTAATGDGTSDEITYAAEEAPRWKVLNIQYQVQQTGYWCGPTATRMALSARMTSPPSQQALATQLGTTTAGTDWIGQITRVLNANLGQNIYATREMPNDPPTHEQRDRLWNDIVRSINANYAIVANIVAPPSNHPPGYPNNQTIYHYFAVIGYNPDTRQVYIADSANFGGNKMYWLTFDQLATLIPPKGYSTAVVAGTTCPGGPGFTQGAIDEKYRALGGCGSVLGAPLTGEETAPDGVGRYNVFERGSIYWTPRTGAHEVHGGIRDAWKRAGWEAGILGYPLTDETKTPDGIGRYNVFERGSIYWTERTGAHEVHGRIRDAWAENGWEAGALGYPTTDEYAIDGGRRSDFEHGSIEWRAATNATTVTVAP